MQQRPINCVTWHQARAYAHWLGGELPSEAQWEFIATSRGRRSSYPWGQSPPKSIHLSQSKTGTSAVCHYPQGHSKQGICDLAGNVWEWTLDEGYVRALDDHQLLSD